MVFVEGGGNSSSLQSPARKAFTKLVDNAGLRDRMPKIVVCGGRDSAIRRFLIAVNNGDEAVLLVDSEGPVDSDDSAAAHLIARGEISAQNSGLDKRIHLMVQIMESWFLTQPDVLSEHFGKNFDPNALPKSHNVETVSKEAVQKGLDKASRNCGKGRYSGNKQQGFEILERLNAGTIEARSRYAKRFFDFLRERCSP